MADLDGAGTTIGIVSVTYYSASTIGAFLDSIAAATTLTPRIVLVDNTPEDDGLSEIVAGDPRVTVVTPHSNLGYGAGMNLGASTLDPAIEWIALVNPDVVMRPGALDRLREAGERRSDAGSLGPLIRNEDGTVYPSARRLPSLRTGIGHAAFIRIWPANPWTMSYRNERSALDEHAVGWLSGAFLLVRRAAFTEVGGFDDRYFMYFEDVDLGRNLGLAGWINLYVPTAEVLHFGALSTSRAPHEMIVAHHRSAYLYLAKRYDRWYFWPIRALVRVGLEFRSRVAKG